MIDNDVRSVYYFVFSCKSFSKGGSNVVNEQKLICRFMHNFL